MWIPPPWWILGQPSVLVHKLARMFTYQAVSASAAFWKPLQAMPTIIESDCFIGARSEVVEGVVVGRGAVLSMGVFIGQSTRLYDRQSGKTHYGKVPPYSVVVPGALPSADGAYSLSCAVIVKTVDEKTRAKTGINELLRAG